MGRGCEFHVSYGGVRESMTMGLLWGLGARSAAGVASLRASPCRREPAWSALLDHDGNETTDQPTGATVAQVHRAGRGEGATCLLEVGFVGLTWAGARAGNRR